MPTTPNLKIPDLAQMAAKIAALVTPGKILTVAIAGPPGSGKSTRQRSGKTYRTVLLPGSNGWLSS